MASGMKTISIFGSTGSVGRNTVDLIAQNPARFRVRALTAGRNVAHLIEQAKLLNPEFVAIADAGKYLELKEVLSTTSIRVGAGEDAILEAASLDVDVTMAAIVGFAGLRPLLKSIEHTKVLAIANKEPLVAAGHLVLEKAKQFGTKILPVDSEHSAIFQVLETQNKDQLKKIILTASGGPFREWSFEDMCKATPKEAIAHPTWTMGPKISVDSATLMNKALEIIEAHHLFGVNGNQIDVVFHPQSIVHSMVEYNDGSVLAQLGAPDMRTPIAYALAWPNRMTTTGQTLDWSKLMTLTFTPPDTVKFPALRLAYECLAAGPAACIAFNRANEIAVANFLKDQITFGDILPFIDKALSLAAHKNISSLDDVFAFDEFVSRHHQL